MPFFVLLMYREIFRVESIEKWFFYLPEPTNLRDAQLLVTWKHIFIAIAGFSSVNEKESVPIG